jgi:P27 family predicted phage terminase small subunit
MGRPRKPNALKVLEGDRQDRINLNEPKSPPGLGEPPEWLDDLAREGWANLNTKLAPMGVAAHSDSELAMVYCHAYSFLREASRIVADDGMTVESVTETATKGRTTVKTTTKAHPLLPMIRGAHRQMVQCLIQFGMSPSARAGLKVPGQTDEDPLLAILAANAVPDAPKRKPKASG